VLYDTGRAVFPLSLLRAVAEVQEQRSLTTNPSGAPKIAHVFPLSALLYCAHCDRQAISGDDGGVNGKLRSKLIGWNAGGKLRYRHSEGKKCTCKQRTMFAHIIEEDFYRLINLLHIPEDAIDLMAEIAVQSQFADLEGQDEAKFEEEKQIAIAKHQRALKNMRLMFKNGEMGEEEYYRDKDYHERQISHLEAAMTDTQQIRMEFTSCREMLKRIQEFWHVTEGEDRKILAHSLFDEIVYDMDTKRIVDFKVKVWAERFLVMRAALYEDQMGLEMKNRFNSGASSEVSYFDPNGLCRLRITLSFSCVRRIRILFLVQSAA
jgi:hypothetical protein